jgi:predicted nucleic acid-binding protein
MNGRSIRQWNSNTSFSGRAQPSHEAAAVDTNIFLEVMLSRTHAAEAQSLIAQGQRHELWLSDFSLHSIGCHLFRRRKAAEFDQFFQDIVVVGGIQIASLTEQQYKMLADVATRLGLDFDDAYQYTVATQQGFTLVSLDADFDRTDLPRKTPAEILAA